MAESILFGHEKGSFTGATESKRGLFEEADGGTIFFDEIGNMPLEIQAKLLRVLQEKEVMRLGSARTLKLNFRVICATNRNLPAMCQDGKFMLDLYQRLSVLPIQLKPLRERREDVQVLVEQFVRTNSALLNKEIRMSGEALAVLKNYAWPGNVRELSNVITYSATVCDSNVIEVSDLPEHVRGNSSHSEHPQSGGMPSISADLSFFDKMRAYEAHLLRQEYQEVGCNVRELAGRLGMDLSHLYVKLNMYGIRKKNPRMKNCSLVVDQDA